MKTEQALLLAKMIKSKRKTYDLLIQTIPYGLTVWWSVVNKRRINYLFEKDDGYLIVYKAYSEVVDQFIKFKLDPCLFITKFGLKIRDISNNYITKFMAQAHYVLNNYYQYDDINNICSDSYFLNKKNIEINHLIDSYTHNDYEQKLLWLKYQGYKNEEISKILKTKRKKIENNLYSIRKRFNSCII